MRRQRVELGQGQGVSPAGPAPRETPPSAADSPLAALRGYDEAASDLQPHLESFLSDLESSGLLERGGGGELASQPSGGGSAEQQRLGPVDGAPGWAAALDTATARVYYWHQESNTVSWEPPPGAAAVLGPPAAPANGEGAAAPAAEPEEDPQRLCEATLALVDECQAGAGECLDTYHSLAVRCGHEALLVSELARGLAERARRGAGAGEWVVPWAAVSAVLLGASQGIQARLADILSGGMQPTQEPAAPAAAPAEADMDLGESDDEAAPPPMGPDVYAAPEGNGCDGDNDALGYRHPHHLAGAGAYSAYGAPELHGGYNGQELPPLPPQGGGYEQGAPPPLPHGGHRAPAAAAGPGRKRQQHCNALAAEGFAARAAKRKQKQAAAAEAAAAEAAAQMAPPLPPADAQPAAWPQPTGPPSASLPSESRAPPTVISKPAVAAEPAAAAVAKPVAASAQPAAVVAGGKPLLASTKVAGLMSRWAAIQKEVAAEEDGQAAEAADPEARRRREAEEWRRAQLRSGGAAAAENANFAPLAGDWRSKVRGGKKGGQASRARASATAEAAAAGAEAAAAEAAPAKETSPAAGGAGGRPGPARAGSGTDLEALSEGLPAGWTAMLDAGSGNVYFGNVSTQVAPEGCPPESQKRTGKGMRRFAWRASDMAGRGGRV